MLRAQRVVWALQRCRLSNLNFHLWQHISKQPYKPTYFPVRKYTTDPVPTLRWEIPDTSAPISTSPPQCSEWKAFEPLDRGVFFSLGFPEDKESELHFLYSVCAGEYTKVVDCVEKHGIEIQDHFGNTPLHWAAAADQVDILRFLISLGGNVHKSNKQGLTPLFAAACGTSAQCIELLIEKGALTSIRDFSGHTALHYAAWMGTRELVETLVKNHKFQIDALSNVHRTPLHYAVSNTDTTRALLSLGAKVDVTDKEGFTPLHFAATEAGVVVKELVKAGAKLEAVDNDGFTPIMHAAHLGHTHALTDLCECGADVNFVARDDTTPLMHASLLSSTESLEILLRYGAKIDRQTQAGDTSLMFAISKGKTNAAKFLIEKGSNLELKRQDGNIPLTIAIQVENQEIMQALVRAGASVDGIPTARPLQLACFLGKLDLAEELVRLGANIEAQSTKYGDTALCGAMDRGHAHVVEWLIKKGVNVNAQNYQLQTPLYAASTEECVELLVNAGANIHAMDRMGRAPIHEAVYNARFKVIEKLVAMGADVNVVSQNSAIGTPLQLAACKRVNNVQTIQTLLRLGAQVNAQNTSGMTPLFYASDADAVNALVDAGADVHAYLGYNTKHEPLLAAVVNKRQSAAHALLQRGANVEATSSIGWTPLMGSVTVHGNSAVTNLLLEHGANVNAVSPNGNYPLHIAAKNVSDIELFPKLVPSAGVDVKNSFGHSPLCRLIAWNKSDFKIILVEKFIEMGANIDDAIAKFREEGNEALVKSSEELKIAALKLQESNIAVKKLLEEGKPTEQVCKISSDTS